MFKKKIFKTTRKTRKKGVCFFCKQNKQPNYKDADVLKRFITERGKIVARLDSSVCHKHQRELTKSVKRARFLALLPYIVRPT